MENKPKKKKWLKKKLLSRYRLVVLNENTFEEQLYFRLSRLNVIIITTLVFSLFFVGTLFLVAYTSIKEYMPGYASTTMRKQSAENTIRLDSLMNAYAQSEQYMASMKKVLQGDISYDEFEIERARIDSQRSPKIEIPKRGKEDSLLRLIVENEDRFNVIENQNNNVDFVLFPPAKGSLSQTYDPQNNHYAVDVVLNENDPIKAVAEGTVIFSEWTADTGFVIIVEHPFGLLSVYKHNSALNKSQGERVVAGEVIATAGNTGELSTGWHLHFELWNDGFAMNPQNFIDFSDQ